MPHEGNKEANGTFRVASVIGKIVVVLDNTGSLVGAVNIVTHLFAHLHVHTYEGDHTSKTGDADDADGGIKSETLKEE